MTELTPRAARKRRKIIDEAARVLATDGPLSMNDLVQKIDVSRATLYRYFPTREVLVRAIAMAYFEDSNHAVTGIFDGVSSYREAFSKLFTALTPMGHYHFLSREWELMDDPEIRKLLEEQSQQTLELIEAAQVAGELNARVPTRWIAKHFDAMLWLAWEAVHEGSVARLDVSNLAFETFWSGVGT